MNVLITSASRKVWLVKRFKDALKKENISGKVIAADIDPLNPALFYSDDKFILPLNNDPKFKTKLVDLCIEKKIKLIVPTRSGELMFFSQNKQYFNDNGIIIMVSEPAIINICNDKLAFYMYLSRHKYFTPHTSLVKELDVLSTFPYIVKPRLGAGSVGIFKIYTQDQFNYVKKIAPNSIVQEFITGQEYTIDLFSDFNGNVISVVPRERLLIVAGESYKGRTVKNFEIIKKSMHLAEQLGTIGHITIQGILNKKGFYFIEINPRYGGGASLGIEAGANTPQFILKIMLNRPIEYSLYDFIDGLYMLRYTEDVFVKSGE